MPSHKHLQRNACDVTNQPVNTSSDSRAHNNNMRQLTRHEVDREPAPQVLPETQLRRPNQPASHSTPNIIAANHFDKAGQDAATAIEITPPTRIARARNA